MRDVGGGAQVVVPLTQEIVAQGPCWTARVGTATIPCRGQTRAADRVIVREFEAILIVLLVDVAGHGARAAQLADTLVQAVSGFADAPPDVWFTQIHQWLRGSDGAVAGMLRADLTTGAVQCAIVGDVQCRQLVGPSRLLRAQPGLLGVNLPRVHVDVAAAVGPARWMLGSDGLRSDAWFALDDHPAERDLLPPRALAHWVLEHFARHHDDASCAVLELAPYVGDVSGVPSDDAPAEVKHVAG